MGVVVNIPEDSGNLGPRDKPHYLQQEGVGLFLTPSRLPQYTLSLFDVGEEVKTNQPLSLEREVVWLAVTYLDYLVPLWMAGMKDRLKQLEC